MTKTQLKRIEYIVRWRGLQADLPSDASVDVFAEVVADQLIVYLRTLIPGREVPIETPTNRWNAFLYSLGLPYRKRTLRVTANGSDNG